MNFHFQVTETNKGVKCIHVNGFKYRWQRLLQNGNISWRCTFQSCCRTIVTDPSVSEIIGTIADHHEQRTRTPQNRLDAASVRAACKRKATDDLCKKPLKIIHQILRESPRNNASVDNQDIQYISEAIYRRRRSLLPPLPRSIDEAVSQVTKG